MSLEVPLVFISSTSEFSEERRELAARIRADEELGAIPYLYEAEAPSSTSPMAECARRLRDADVVVLLIGARYGTPLPAPTGLFAWCRRRIVGPDKPKSIVEWEYEYAKALPRALHPYVRQFPVDVEVDELQERFRKDVTHFESGRWSVLYTRSEELVTRSLTDLRKWRLGFWRLYKESFTERNSWTQRVLLSVAAILGVALAAVSIMALSHGSASSNFAIGALVIALLTVAYLLAKSGDIS